MHVLALNAGSSSLKFRLFEIGSDASVLEDPVAARGATVARGSVSHLGTQPVLDVTGPKVTMHAPVTCRDHAAAFGILIESLRSADLLPGDGELATGHRIVHGGTRFREPIVVDPAILRDLRDLSALAPLHNAAACSVLARTHAELGEGVPAVAVFDTAFHAEMPEHAANYAIPWELAQKHGIRRFGFHGLAHAWMAERWARLSPHPKDRRRVITLQLGQGCSAAAVRQGRSLDVTMGFTPLEGLMMGTRSGDVDPALIPFLAEREGVGAREVERWLESKSGLLGVSGISSDLRVVQDEQSRGVERARSAVEMFTYRIQKSIGALQAVLGGVDAIVFSGGIGENSAEVRARTAGEFGWCGIELDAELNQAPAKGERRISAAGSAAEVWVIPAEEEILIARAVHRLVGGSHLR